MPNVTFVYFPRLFSSSPPTHGSLSLHTHVTWGTNSIALFEMLIDAHGSQQG